MGEFSVLSYQFSILVFVFCSRLDRSPGKKGYYHRGYRGFTEVTEKANHCFLFEREVKVCLPKGYLVNVALPNARIFGRH